MRSDDDMPFVFGRGTRPSRLMAGLAAGTILCLAIAVTDVSLRRLPVAAERDGIVAAGPGPLVRLRASARRDAVRIAHARPRPAPASVPALTARRSAAARIAASRRGLRAVQHTGPSIRPRRHLTLTLARLDADGVVGETSLPATHDIPSADGRTALSPAGVGPGAVAFDSGLGRVTTAARAGTLNGQPAAALDIGLSDGAVRFDAAGMTDVASLADPGTLRRAFKVSTGASIPLD